MLHPALCFWWGSFWWALLLLPCQLICPAVSPLDRTYACSKEKWLFNQGMPCLVGWTKTMCFWSAHFFFCLHPLLLRRCTCTFLPIVCRLWSWWFRTPRSAALFCFYSALWTFSLIPSPKINLTKNPLDFLQLPETPGMYLFLWSKQSERPNINSGVLS